MQFAEKFRNDRSSAKQALWTMLSMVKNPPDLPAERVFALVFTG